MTEVWSLTRLWMTRLLVVTCAVVLFQSASVRAHTQSGGAVAGAVLDPQGKVVIDAALVIRNDATGELRTATTDANGHFSVAGLMPGLYSIEVAVPGFAIVRRADVAVSDGKTEEISIKLSLANVTEEVTVSAALPAAAVAAASQGSLTSRSAQSLISNEYIRNYTSPISDYSQVLQMAPGTYSVSANGPGLSDTKTFFRGFKDGFYSMSYDGIPFHDTNDPTHHSWVFFPAQTIGSTVFDRSPGSASSIGPSTYGGSINLLSRSLPSQQWINGSISYGSFNTKLFDVEFDSGRFGGSGKSRLMIDAHDMRSDGYQTFNFQKRDAFSAKYQHAASDNTMLTAFTSIVDLHSNTPNQKGATRAQIQQFGDNFLSSGDPTSPLYYKFNFYHVPTNFQYFGIKSDRGNGWSVDTKTYTMRYHPSRLGLEVPQGHARRGLLLHQVPERLQLSVRPGLRGHVLLPDRHVGDQGRRGRKHDPGWRRPRRVPERHEGHRKVLAVRPVGSERAEGHRNDRRDYNMRSWNLGLFSKRVGQQWNDNGSDIHQAVATDPFNITNLFINYTLRGSSKFSQSRIRLAINNLTDSHSITATTPASTKSNLPAPGDVLTLMSGRSVAVSFTVGFSPRSP